MPIAIDGMPVSTSLKKRTVRGQLAAPEQREVDAGEHADRQRRTSDAIAMISSDPTMALATPPPVMPTGSGSFVKKSQLSAL